MVVSHSYQIFVPNVKKRIISHYVNHCSTPDCYSCNSNWKKTGTKTFCHEFPLIWSIIYTPISEYCIDLWFICLSLFSTPFAILYFFVFVLYFPLSHSDILPVLFFLKNTGITKYFKVLSLTWLYGYFVFNLVLWVQTVYSGWLLRKRYAHTLEGVSWHTCRCIFVCFHTVWIEMCQINILKLKLKW